jgi:hypothetical protein
VVLQLDMALVAAAVAVTQVPPMMRVGLLDLAVLRERPSLELWQ